MKFKLMNILLEISTTMTTVYHGTRGGNKNIPSIKSNGLTNTMHYSPKWYMLSTDFESALYHASPSEDGGDVYVIEYEVPLDNESKWMGYPFFWKSYDRSSKSQWYSLKMKLDSKYIKNIHKISNADWRKQKNEGF